MTADQTIALDTQLDRFFGKYRGLVLSNQDPIQAGRLQVSVPDVLGSEATSWAMPCAPYAGLGSGLYTLPPVGAPVWVEFEAGDPSRPIWSGGWWGPQEAPPPPQGGPASPDCRQLVTETGLRVSMDDLVGAITISDRAGVNLVKIETITGQITILAAAEVVLEAPVINHGREASEPAVHGTQLFTYLTQLTALFNAHLHPGELAAGILPVTPAPPVAPMPPPVISLLSIKNFVE